jgi:hypothetical protein
MGSRSRAGAIFFTYVGEALKIGFAWLLTGSTSSSSEGAALLKIFQNSFSSSRVTSSEELEPEPFLEERALPNARFSSFS